MRKLSDHHTHVLAVVARHERICLGIPVDPDWAPIADDLRRLAKWKYLIEDGDGDDGPAYELAPAGRAAVNV